MAFCGGDFHARQNEKAVYRQTVAPHQPTIEEVIDRVTSIVIGHREPIKALAPGCFDQLFWTTHTVARKKGVTVQIKFKGHGRAAYLIRNFRSVNGRCLCPS